MDAILHIMLLVHSYGAALARPCLAFCDFNSQNGIETWFESIERCFLLQTFGIRRSADGRTGFRQSGADYAVSIEFEYRRSDVSDVQHRRPNIARLELSSYLTWRS